MFGVSYFFKVRWTFLQCYLCNVLVFIYIIVHANIVPGNLRKNIYKPGQATLHATEEIELNVKYFFFIYTPLMDQKLADRERVARM